MCGECGPSLKDVLLLTHLCLPINLHHQPLQVTLETSHQLVKIKLEERKEKSNSLASYAQEITLFTFVLV